jgi:hypothetical protein
MKKTVITAEQGPHPLILLLKRRRTIDCTELEDILFEYKTENAQFNFP